MTPFNDLKSLAQQIGEELARRAADVPDVVLQQLMRHFPGLNVDLVRRQWIPISGQYLQDEVHRRAASIRHIESLDVRCRPDHFEVTVSLQAGPLSHKATLELIPRDFALDRSRRLAVLVANPNVQVEGRNFLGRVSAWLAEAAVVRALQSDAVARKVSDASLGAVEMDWPRILVHLDRIEQLRSILDYRVLGYTLLDVLRFGPLRVEQDYAYLKVGLVRRKESGRITG